MEVDRLRLYPMWLELQSVSGAIGAGGLGGKVGEFSGLSVFNNNLLSTYHVPGTVFSMINTDKPAHSSVESLMIYKFNNSII